MSQREDPTFLYDLLFEDEFKARLAEGWRVNSASEMVTTVVHSVVIRIETTFTASHTSTFPEIKMREPLHTYLHQVLDKKLPGPETLSHAQLAAKSLGLVNLAAFLPKLPEHVVMCEQRIHRHYAVL